MTRDDVIRMARGAGAYPLLSEGNHQLSGDAAAIERFAALIEAAATEKANDRANTSWALMCEKMVAAEREACAKVCELRRTGGNIREDIEAKRCAEAIRARGN